MAASFPVRRVFVRVSVAEAIGDGWRIIEDEARSIEARPDVPALRDALDAAIDVIAETIPDEAETRPVEKVSPANQHADGYRRGWSAALETVLREVEDLPAERIETGGAVAPFADGGHQAGEYVEVVGMDNVLAIIREALGA